MPSLTRNIPHNSEQAKGILRELQFRVRKWESGVASKKNKWQEAEERILAYLPAREVDQARATARDSGLPQYTTIQIPYSYSVVMAAYTYLTSVFMGRDPVFQFTGRHGESQKQVQAMEALVAYQVLLSRMVVYLHTWLYDALKYGDGIIGCYWDEQYNVVTDIVEQQDTDPLSGLPIGAPKKVQQSTPHRTYAGNCIHNVQPQSFIWDTRVTLREFQSGEFCGEKKRLSWNEVIRRKKKGYYMNIEALDSGASVRNSWTTTVEGSSQLERPDDLPIDDSTGNPDTNPTRGHPNEIEVYQLAIEVIPNEWKLGGSDYPEKWVFTCTTDWNTLIGVQPLGAWHCKFPYSVIPLEPEGYGLTSRGLPQILEPVQNTVDWLVNSHFFNVRAALNNKFVVDPSAVVMKDVLDPLPGGIIRLKPERYGTDTKLAMTQMAVTDVTRTHIADVPMMFGIGERAGGVNDQIMGMLAAGGRKTATEVRTSTSFGINRLKTTAEFASAAGFDPLSMMIVSNSQQYYDMQLKFKIAGDLALSAGQNFIMVDPEAIAGFYDFVPVDGTLPIDRMAQVQLWQELFQSILAVPAIGMQYDLGGIFTWVAQLAGLKNITQFRIQVLPDQVLAAQAAQGNSIPLGGAKGSAAPTRPQGATGYAMPAAAAA